MGRIIVATGLLGWAAIIWIAWRMADARIETCRFESDCVIRTTATRDFVLTVGLTVALAFVILSLCVFAFTRTRYGRTFRSTHLNIRERYLRLP